MPSWIIHLKTANELNKKWNLLEENSFLLGNIMPDAERHVIKDLSFVVPYDISHYAEHTIINGVDQKITNPDKFVKKHRNQFNNPMVLGYLVHLLTDNFWNLKTFHKSYKTEEEAFPIEVQMNNEIKKVHDREEVRILKQHDFDLFSAQIVQTYLLPTLNFDDKLLVDSKQIEEIPIHKEDVNKYIQYVKKLEMPIIEGKKEYWLFTPEEINKDFNESLQYIEDFLDKNKIKNKF